jgi:hypothetical protein
MREVTLTLKINPLELNSFKKFKVPTKPYSKKEYGVGGNTFRAISIKNKKLNLKPSQVYQQWAKDKISSFDKYASKNSSFQKLHNDLFSDFKKHWKDQTHQELELAHALKLVDLYIKWVCLSSNNKVVKEYLLKNAYCPLDRFSLAQINKCFNDVFPFTNTSMGAIKSIESYNTIQNLISEFCKIANRNPIEFDLWSWDNEHIKQFQATN